MTVNHADIYKQRVGYHVELFGNGGWSRIRGGKFRLTLWGATRLARRWIRQPIVSSTERKES